MTTRFVLLGLALAMPLQAQRVTLGANFGGSSVRVHDKGTDSAFSRFAGNLGVGVGYRLGRVGLRAEGRSSVVHVRSVRLQQVGERLAVAGGVDAEDLTRHHDPRGGGGDYIPRPMGPVSFTYSASIPAP